MRQHWEAEELVEHWTLGEEDIRALRNKTGATRLGFAVLLKFFEQEGRFPNGPVEVPVEVVDFVACQLGLSLAMLAAYDWSGRSWKVHRAQIRKRFGFRESNEADAEALTGWLAEKVWPQGPRRQQAEAALVERCRKERLEPPSPGRITRILNSSGHRFDERFASTTLKRLPNGTRDALEKLLVADSVVDAESRSLLAFLKSDPGRVGLESVLVELDKLSRLRALELSTGLFDGVSAKVIRTWRDRAAAEAPSTLTAHPERIRLALLGALCWSRRREVTDTLVDLLIAVVHKIGAKAERRVERELIADLRQVTGKTNLLFRLADAAVEHPDGIVSEVLYPVVGEQTLRDLVREYKSTGPAYRNHVIRTCGPPTAVTTARCCPSSSPGSSSGRRIRRIGRSSTPSSSWPATWAAPSGSSRSTSGSRWRGSSRRDGARSWSTTTPRASSGSTASPTRSASYRPCGTGCAARRSLWKAPTGGATPTKISPPTSTPTEPSTTSGSASRSTPANSSRPSAASSPPASTPSTPPSPPILTGRS
jgi:hypothetical protein